MALLNKIVGCIAYGMFLISLETNFSEGAVRVAKEREFPFMVIIRFPFKPDDPYFYVGVLVADNLVITDGHCMKYILDSQKFEQFSQIYKGPTVIAGTLLSEPQLDDPEYQVRQVKRFNNKSLRINRKNADLPIILETYPPFVFNEHVFIAPFFDKRAIKGSHYDENESSLVQKCIDKERCISILIKEVVGLLVIDIQLHPPDFCREEFCKRDKIFCNKSELLCGSYLFGDEPYDCWPGYYIRPQLFCSGKLIATEIFNFPCEPNNKKMLAIYKPVFQYEEGRLSKIRSHQKHDQPHHLF